MWMGNNARHETKGKTMKNDIMNSILDSKEFRSLRLNFYDVMNEYRETKKNTRDFWLSNTGARLFGWKVEFHVKPESVHVLINLTDVFSADTIFDCFDWVTAQIFIGNGSFDEKKA